MGTVVCPVIEAIDDEVEGVKVLPVLEASVLLTEAADTWLDVADVRVVMDEGDSVSVELRGPKSIVVRPIDPSGYVVNANMNDE